METRFFDLSHLPSSNSEDLNVIDLNMLYNNKEKIPQILPDINPSILNDDEQPFSKDIWNEITDVIHNLLSSLPDFPSPPIFMSISTTQGIDKNTQRELNNILQNYGIKQQQLNEENPLPPLPVKKNSSAFLTTLKTFR